MIKKGKKGGRRERERKGVEAERAGRWPRFRGKNAALLDPVVREGPSEKVTFQ